MHIYMSYKNYKKIYNYWFENHRYEYFMNKNSRCLRKYGGKIKYLNLEIQLWFRNYLTEKMIKIGKYSSMELQ